MLRGLAGISLVHGPLPTVVFSLTAIAFILLVALYIRVLCLQNVRKTTQLSLVMTKAMPVIMVIVAGLVGLLACWLVSDVFMVFGVSLGWLVISTFACGCAGLGFVITLAAVCRPSLVSRKALRHTIRIIAIFTILLIVMSTGLRIDAIYGEYQTIGSIINYSSYSAFTASDTHRATMSVAQWRELETHTGLPKRGKVFTINIPNTHSGFKARTAMIYLPPAALADEPPALPVMELLAGQPGSPGRLIAAGNIASMMNTYAAAHNGLAPVVVVPDQNGSDTHNSLCADTSQGNAETYLTRDVVEWTERHLPVATNARMWAIGGFSQGGTCTTQLAPRHPNLYGAMLPVDGELKPTNGTVEQMTKNYFRGKKVDYDAQVPVNAIAATGSSAQALFTGAGERDSDSIHNMHVIANAARKAGMEVTELVVPGTGHDWHAVQAVWKPGLDWFGERTGLGDMKQPISDYPQVEVQ